eukprot:TRINITY_DN8234_c0_g1_i1.p1 TRINITY_DN8234_c0_g1~~TRINITY_DN8234_c0_g1_i1.p1  ORF type:complete len:180 (-),score=32.74 TRINITY_DN8234_c0_g1_i1:33-539(-)
MAEAQEDKVVKTDAEWKAELDPEAYGILRLKHTEAPFTGEYEKFSPKEGHFVCRGCKNPLYSAAAKFHSGCGWPAFDKCYEGAIKTEVDDSIGRRRIEIMCAKCDGHLGHVFEGERFTETNERHCVNSKSVKYVEASLPDKQEIVITKTLPADVNNGDKPGDPNCVVQ